jgi:hypothetical protein
MMLEDSPLEFLRFSVRSYEEAGEGGIPMVTGSGTMRQGATMGLTSFISQLPD